MVFAIGPYSLIAAIQATDAAAAGLPRPGRKPDGTLTAPGEPGWTTARVGAIQHPDGSDRWAIPIDDQLIAAVDAAGEPAQVDAVLLAEELDESWYAIA